MENKVKSNEQYMKHLKRKGSPIDKVARLENDIDKLDSMPWEFEQSYREMLEYIPEMIFMVDMKGKFLFTNKSWSEYTGYSHDDPMLTSLFDLAHPDDLQVIKARFTEVFKGNSIRDFEFKSKTKDGSYIDIQISLSPMHGSKRNVVAAFGIGRDNTERRKMEKKYKQLLEDMKDGYAVIQGTKIMFANKRCGEIFGYEPGQEIGHEITEFIAPDNLQQVMEQYMKVVNGEEETLERFELMGMKRDGAIIPIQSGARSIEYEGKPAYSVILRDITERKASEEKYRHLLENMNDGYAVIQDMDIVFANGRLCEIFGYELGQMIGRGIKDFIAPDNVCEAIELYTKMIDGEEEPVGQIMVMGIKRDGTIFPIQSGARPINYEGKPAYSVIVRDVTEWECMGEALLESQDKYRSMVETADKAGIGIGIVQNVGNREGIVVFANDEILRITGYSREELIGKAFQDILISDDLSGFIDRYRRRQAGEEISGYSELWLLRKDGTKVPIECCAGMTTYQNKVATISYIRDITERKQADEMLRESEQRFRAIFNNALDGICLADAETRQLYTSNNVFCQMLGYNLEEIGKMEVTDIHPKQDLPYVLDQFTRQVQGEITLAKDIPMLRRDGSIFYTDVNSSLLTIGGKTYLIGIFRDITERKKMEEKYRQLLEDVYDGYAVLQDGKYVFTNHRFCEILGYEQGEMLGKSFMEILLPENRQAMAELYEKILCSEEAPDEKFEDEAMKADGTTVIIEARAKPILYESKPAFSIIIRDTSELKRAQEELKRSEEYFRSLIENTSDVIDVIGRDGNISYISPSVESVLGYKPEELIGKMGYDLIHPDDLSTAMIALTQTVQTSRYSDPLEIRVHHKDGSWHIVQVIGNNLLDHPSVAGIVTNIRDITDRKRMEEKYRQLLEDMKDGYVVIQDDNIVFANERLSEIFGYKPGQAIGHNITEFIASDNLQKIVELYNKVINGEEEAPERLELMGIKRDGTIFPLQGGAKVIEYDGKPAYSVIVRDITERKQVDEMLQKSQDKLQSILKTLPDILSHVSRDGTFLDEPMGQYDIQEQYPSTFYMKNVSDVFPGDFADGALKAIKTALNNGVPQVMEHKLPISLGTKDEDVYETRIVPFGRDEVLAISRDITAQKLSERRLRTYQQQLQSLTSQLSQAEERERRRLAADLHDLIGQSLAVIKMKLNEWKDTLYSSGHAATMKEVLKIIDSAINNTRSLTFDLSPPVLYELGLEAALEFLLEQFHERHALQYEFNDDNQEKLIEDEVRILLYRCANELLMNVVKHSKAQLVKLSIRREDSQVCITLEDDGVGFAIPEAEIGGEVQGFGLFSIRERLNWIGGSFKLESNPGSGTHATLQAPLRNSESDTRRKK